MNRLLIAALVVIVLAVAVMFIVPSRTATTTVVERPNPMTKIETGEVTKVVIEHTEGKGDNRHKQRVVLVRGEGEGDSEPLWSLEEPVKADANKTPVESLIKRLGELEFIDVASESSQSHEDLEVTGDNAISVEVYAGDNRLASFILGKYASGHTMLRLPDQDAVYRVRGSLRYVFAKRASDWRDKEIFDFEREQISQITFQNEKGTFVFARDLATEDADWVVASVDALAPVEEEEAEDEGEAEGDEGEEPTKTKARPVKTKTPPAPERVTTIEDYDASRVKSLVSSVARLRCTDFLDETEGVDTGLEAEGAARVSFKVGSGDTAQEHILVIGREHEERNVYAKRADRDQIFVLTKHLADRLRPDVAAFQKRSTSASKAPTSLGPGGLGGLGGLEGLGGGGGKIPPGVLKAAQEQIAREKMIKQLAEQASKTAGQ